MLFFIFIPTTKTTMTREKSESVERTWRGKEIHLDKKDKCQLMLSASKASHKVWAANTQLGQRTKLSGFATLGYSFKYKYFCRFLNKMFKLLNVSFITN